MTSAPNAPYYDVAFHEGYDCSGFSCGKPQLDDWLKRHALQAENNHTARTFVWIRDDYEAVVAYYSLVMHTVRKEELPDKVARGGPNAVPAVLLARLALDQKLHGQRLGAEVLVSCPIDS